MAVSLLAETWTWYAVATTILVLRLVARSLVLGGVQRLKLEDYIMLFALVAYTNEVYWMNIVATEKSNLIRPGLLNHHHFTPTEKDKRASGSKLTVVVEQCQLSTIWAIKFCLLTMYWRLTKDAYPKHHLAVKILMGYTAFTFVFMEICYFFVWCRPFSEYYAVPTDNPTQCAAALNHLITNAVFNLTSDLAMISIALNMIFKLNFAPHRKFGLLVLVLLGFFVVACAVANKAYSFSNPYGSQWTFWYIREASTAVLIANLPYAFTLMRRVFGFSDKQAAPGRKGSTPISLMGRVKKRLMGMKDSGSFDPVMSRRTASVADLAPTIDGHTIDGRTGVSETERKGSASKPMILGKADALALQDLEAYGVSPMSSQRNSQFDSPSSNPPATPQAQAGAQEQVNHNPFNNSALGPVDGPDDDNLIFVTSPSMVASPNHRTENLESTVPPSANQNHGNLTALPSSNANDNTESRWFSKHHHHPERHWYS